MTSIEAKAFVLIVTVGALLTRAIGVIGLLTDRAKRRDPLTWLLVGGGLAGAGAVALLFHSSAAQYYFARSAVPLLALGSALGLVVVVDKLGARARTVLPVGVIAGSAVALLPWALFGPLEAGGMREAAMMIGVAALVLAITAVATAVGRSMRWVAVGATLIVAVLAGGMTVVAHSLVEHRWTAPTAPAVDVNEVGAVSRDQIAAARWIRDHSDADDMVMTNRHCVGPKPPGGCSSRRFVVAAFSERQVLVEGWSYTPQMAELSRGWICATICGLLGARTAGAQ